MLDGRLPEMEGAPAAVENRPEARHRPCARRYSDGFEPTRGVDVGARQDIYRILRQRARDGAAVVVATSDAEEAVQIADRVVVFVRGRIALELSGPDITTDRLARAVGG